MGSVRLTVHRLDGVEVAVLERGPDGVLAILRATDRMRPDLQRIVERGLAEFLGEPGNRRPRRTPPHDPSLLERLAERLQRYNFVTAITRPAETP